MPKRRKITILDCQNAAKKKSGKCLSETCESTRLKLLWECHLGHKWEATAHSVVGLGSWCPACIGRDSRLQVQKLTSLLKGKSWKWVDGKYTTFKDRSLLIQCDQGHEWKTSHQKIKYYGCPECSNRCHDVEKNQKAFEAVVREKEGEWISGAYQNAHSKIVIRCSKGHEWETKPVSVKNAGTWCPTCKGLNKKEQLKRMQHLAKQRGGKCISSSYVNKNTNIDFECSNGHIFCMRPSSVINGSWCPKCSYLFMENKTRYTFEKLTDKHFNKCGTRIKPYELDGYLKEEEKGLEIAFEYHGIQHYVFVPYFHGTKEEFQRRQKEDQEKISMCQEKGIKLLIVPYFEANTDRELLLYVISLLEQIKLNYKVPHNAEVFYREFYEKSPQIRRLKEIVKEKDGELLTYEYNGSRTPMTVKCKEGHIWTTPYINLTQGKFCSTCSKRSKDKVWLYNDLKQKVESVRWTLLTNHYVPDREKVSIMCDKGHTFERTVNSMKSKGGKRCPVCSGMQS